MYGSVPGGQAEYLRVPMAHFGPIKLPDEHQDERFLYLSDVLPTAWQAVEYADIPKGGSVAVFGLGPIGQMSTRISAHHGAENPWPVRTGDRDDIHVCVVLPGAADTPILEHVANYTGRQPTALPPAMDPSGSSMPRRSAH